MWFQILYCVESDFSVSFGPKPKLNNNKKGRLGGGGITYKQKYSLIRGHISTTTPWGVGLTSISNKPEVRGGDGKFLSFRESYISNLGLLLSLEASKKFVWWRFQRLYHEVPKIISC